MESSEHHAYEASATVSVSELRQWRYCPRVVWYGRSLGDVRPTSGAMRAGIDAEAERQRLEERRTFHQYALEACSKRFQVPVASQRLGLAGRVDCLFELTEVTLEHAAGGVRPAGWEADRPLFVPVEYKTTFRTDRKENVLQLMAYAAILEDLTGTPVPFGFLVFLPEEEVVRVDLGPGLRKTLGVLVDEVRAGLGDAELPPPTPFRGRCVDCEFRRFCNDVF